MRGHELVGSVADKIIVDPVLNPSTNQPVLFMALSGGNGGIYRSLDGGHVVFAANDSGRRGDDEGLTKNPRQCVRYDIHAVYLGNPGPDQDQNCPPAPVV